MSSLKDETSYDVKVRSATHSWVSHILGMRALYAAVKGLDADVCLPINSGRPLLALLACFVLPSYLTLPALYTDSMDGILVAGKVSWDLAIVWEGG